MKVPRARSVSLVVLVATFWSAAVTGAGSPDRTAWVSLLEKKIRAIDAQSPGSLGVFVKRVKDGSTMTYEAEKKWYLASTIKILVAIAILQEQESGRLSLDEELTLRSEDRVDGSGDLLVSQPYSRHSIGELLEKMLVRSDSTAADMLIRRIGEENLNRKIEHEMGVAGFGPITTLLRVRYAAFGELHESVANLTNLDFIELKKVRGPRARLRALMRKLGLKREQLGAKSIDEAFERYYARGYNSGSLVGFGTVLEKLVRRELLSPAHTELLLGYMEQIQTGDHRIKAGIPKSGRFAQKTGTQVRRLCNVGVMFPGRSEASERSEDDAVVVAACVEKYADFKKAERSLQHVGRAISESGLLN
ncbi:MAG TPA: serine hydrolase [Bdellovibrionota bacterium]|nr:serine hydrolase [Bdellovibrionota bacterium]